MDYLLTALISLASATLPCIVAIIQIRNESKKIREQHEFDIEAIREQHQLELIAKEKDFEREKEIMQLKHDQTLELNEKSTTNGVGVQAITGLLGQIFQSPQLKEHIDKEISQALNPEE